jgi:two-component system, LuxR family, response regulator FixJ
LSKGRISVVVLDDDVSVSRALKAQLEILGFTVRVFHSASELLATEIPSRDVCLLVDVYLPDVNGIELCQKLNATGTYLPTILISGRDDDETRRMMRSAKPIASLFKPFSERALLRAIRKATRLRGTGINR